MKKLAIFGLCILMVATAFGQFNNLYRKDLGAVVLASTDRVLVYDESGSVSSGTKMGYINYSDLMTNLYLVLPQTARATIDTNTVVADASAATQSVSLLSGDLLEVTMYTEAGWDNSDFVEFNNADSNATTLDTLNMGLDAGFADRTFRFFATQDTVIYFNLGDSVSVASTVEAFLIWNINR